MHNLKPCLVSNKAEFHSVKGLLQLQGQDTGQKATAFSPAATENTRLTSTWYHRPLRINATDLSISVATGHL